MMNGGLSASDVAVLSGSNNRADEGYGFGGGWAWWIIILLIFGWGGFGGFGGYKWCRFPRMGNQSGYQ